MSSRAMYIDKELLRREAFRGLSKWGILVYLDFLRLRKMNPIKRPGRETDWEITNNGEIVYPYSVAERKGISRRQFRNAIDELVDRGFLDATHWGSGGVKGDVSRFELVDRWKHFGTPDFQPAKKPRIRQTHRGGWKGETGHRCQK